MTTELASLGSLLNTYANIAALQQQQMYLENQQSKNAAQLQIQQKHEAAYEKAYDNAMGTTKDISFTDDMGYVIIKASACEETQADRYAHFKVEQYNQELLLELSELDVEYTTLIEAIAVQIEAEDARKEQYKTGVSNGVADTAIVGGE